MPPRLLIQRKLEFGSASALIGNEPPPPELMPMLRGLLNDDEELRWGLDDLEAWLRQERIPHHAGGGTSVSTKALRVRSEAHTAELQSLLRTSYAGFFLHKK